MFEAARREVRERTLGSRRLLSSVQILGTSRPLEVAAYKGLILVQLYGVYEYAVQSAVRATLSAISSDRPCAQDLHRAALTLILNSPFLSVVDSGRRTMWQKRLSLVASLESPAPLAPFDDTIFPSDGSQYRVKQLQTIWSIFGLDALGVPVVPEARVLGRIEELVENRNAISHGRRTPEEVGGRYSTAEIEGQITDIEKLALYIITAMEDHYKAGGVRR